MVSNIRRSSRAYQYGSKKECIGCREKRGKGRGDPSHAVLWMPRCRWQTEVGHNPLREYGLPGHDVRLIEYRPEDIGLVTVYGAEKSCRTRRRKRGLRRGKLRSRGRHPRRLVQPPAPESKTPSARVVNHSGRKFLWAMRASESLRKDCKKYAKFPVGPLPENHPARLPRKKMKEHCAVKWARLHARAEAAGIPPVAAFHSTFWKYLAVETSRGKADWDGLLAGLPGNPATDFKSVRGLFDRLEERASRGPKRRPRGGGSRGAMNNPRGGRGGSRGKRMPPRQ